MTSKDLFPNCVPMWLIWASTVLSRKPNSSSELKAINIFKLTKKLIIIYFLNIYSSYIIKKLGFVKFSSMSAFAALSSYQHSSTEHGFAQPPFPLHRSFQTCSVKLILRKNCHSTDIQQEKQQSQYLLSLSSG